MILRFYSYFSVFMDGLYQNTTPEPCNQLDNQITVNMTDNDSASCKPTTKPDNQFTKSKPADVLVNQNNLQDQLDLLINSADLKNEIQKFHYRILETENTLGLLHNSGQNNDQNGALCESCDSPLIDSIKYKAVSILTEESKMLNMNSPLKKLNLNMILNRF